MHSIKSVNMAINKSCTCCNAKSGKGSNEISRRKFIQETGTSALGVCAFPALSWSVLASVPPLENTIVKRRPLIVKPVFIYSTPVRKDQTSWRNWGGIQTEQDADKELVKIQDELKELHSVADFPVEFLPVTRANKPEHLNNLGNMESVDVILTYFAGRQYDIHDALGKMGKYMIIFARHKSGPVYQTYESMSNNFLRRRTDKLAIDYADEDDIVIDDQDEILWRLRALCGLKNTLNSSIIAVGGPSGWGTGYRNEIKQMTESSYKMNIINVPYEELGNLIKEARSDKRVISQTKESAERYLADPGIKLETRREFVDNAFILEEVFHRLMTRMECRAITINGCMSTIMPLAETTACMTLSLLNDAGYLAFCESDFVVIPSGILLANISGKPVFLNDPTFPHNGVNTLAHCTAPRRMNGQKLEPARIVTHFESDYGAAPKVEMNVNQTVTNIIPNFGGNIVIGVPGKIADNPFMDVCRTQIDVKFDCDSNIMRKQMQGFHWITVYGDYMKETGYSLKKTGIEFKKFL